MFARLSHRSIARVLIASSLVLAGGVASEAAKRPVRAAKVAASTEAPKAASKTDRDCLARAMYFESRRTDEDGMLAVGTVVMNRLATGGRYGSSVCEVVSRPAQFAPGVLTRAMTETRPRELAFQTADLALGGGRHPTAGAALYFHTADVPFRHDDKRYILVSGGNAFYAWNRTGGRARITSNLISLARAVAAAPAVRETATSVAAASAVALREPAQTPAPEAPVVVAPLDAPAADVANPIEVAAVDATVVESATVAMVDARPAKRVAASTTTAGAAAVLAYAAPAAAPVAGTALAAVAALEPKHPRVVTPAAPVQASAGPVWPHRSGAESGARAWSPGAIANAAVDKAWALFDAVRQ